MVDETDQREIRWHPLGLENATLLGLSEVEELKEWKESGERESIKNWCSVQLNKYLTL